MILIDSDIIVYRCAFACKEESLKTALLTTNRFIEDVIVFADHDDCYYDKWRLFLTGKNNYRHEVAVTHPYKGNRTQPKPPKFKEIREHIIKEWGAFVAEGQEADDAIAIEATKLGDECIMATVDKDFDQVPGWHFNFIKKLHYHVSEADATRFFYKQLLTGDATDNIFGLDRVGPKTAEKMLKDCTNEEEMYAVCAEAYDNYPRLLENARLLWLRRKRNQMWEPPL